MTVQPISAVVVKRLREGDETAFGFIYDRLSSRIYSFAHKFLKNREQSEEIVQETFLHLWVNRETLDEQYPISVLLYMIARRLSLNAIRKHANHRIAYEKIFSTLTEGHNDTEEAILLSDLERLTDEVLNQLPQQQRTAFRLSRLEGFSYDEIAGQMNISRNTVKNHIVQAVKNIRIHFVNRDILIISILHFLLKL